MSSRLGLKTDGTLLPGLIAVGLFVVLAAVALTSSFGAPTGFHADGSVMASIGNAMFGLDTGTYSSDDFLVAFEIIDLVLVAALAAAVMLAKREGGALSGVLELRTDGGRDVSDGSDRRRGGAR